MRSRAAQPAAASLDGREEDCDRDTSSLVLQRFDANGQCTHITSASSGLEWLAGGPWPTVFLTKVGVDALVYGVLTEGNGFAVKHLASFHAFAFVQASKRNKRLVAWAPDYSFIALAETSRYVFVYHRPTVQTPRTAVQQLVDLGLESGDVVGLQVLGRRVLVLTTLGLYHFTP